MFGRLPSEAYCRQEQIVVKSRGIECSQQPLEGFAGFIPCTEYREVIEAVAVDFFKVTSSSRIEKHQPTQGLRLLVVGKERKVDGVQCVFLKQGAVAEIQVGPLVPRGCAERKSIQFAVEDWTEESELER